MPDAPIIEPIERSNSPAIISRATAAPRIPTCGRDLEVAGDAAGALRKPFPVAAARRTAKNRKTTMAPMTAPNSGRPRRSRIGLTRRRRSPDRRQARWPWS